MAGKTRVGPLAGVSMSSPRLKDTKANTPASINKLDPLTKSIVTGVPVKGKKKTLKENA